MKKIYIDGLALVEGHFSGIGQYTLGMLKGIDKVIDDASYRRENLPQIKVIIPKDTVKKFKKFGFKHIGYKTFPLPFRYMAALWHRNWLPPIDMWCGRGLYIFPRFVDMRLAFSKSSALVIYDLSYELHRQYSDEKNAQFLSKGVKRSVKNTRKVIAISSNARDEIIKFYKLDPNKVEVANPGVDPAIFYRRSQAEIDEVKVKYGVKGDYILALSNLEPRKNLNSLVEAYSRLPKKISDSLALLLVGVTGWNTDELFDDIVKKVEGGCNIIRPSKYVSDKDKPAIISGAKMLVYPSHYEGFGMPPIEALACGTPVICANNSSLPEVVGEAALTLDSNDIDGLVKAIESYIDKMDTISHKTLVNGPKQAEKYSWVSCAKVFLKAVGVSIE